MQNQASEAPMQMAQIVLSLGTNDVPFQIFHLWPLLPFSFPDVLFGLRQKIKICVNSEHFLILSFPKTGNINKLPNAMGKLPTFCNLNFTSGVYCYTFIHINFVVQKTYSQSLTSFQSGKKVRYHRLCYWILFLWIYWFITKRNLGDVIKVVTQLTSRGKII